jgi:hypothetical protein
VAFLGNRLDARAGQIRRKFRQRLVQPLAGGFGIDDEGFGHAG